MGYYIYPGITIQTSTLNKEKVLLLWDGNGVVVKHMNDLNIALFLLDELVDATEEGVRFYHWSGMLYDSMSNVGTIEKIEDKEEDKKE